MSALWGLEKRVQFRGIVPLALSRNEATYRRAVKLLAGPSIQPSAYSGPAEYATRASIRPFDKLRTYSALAEVNSRKTELSRLGSVEAVEGGRVVAVGVFDGVHWGHRAIFEDVLRVAVERSLRPTALTFDKHPAELLVPDRAPHYINTLDQRVELIKALGIEDAIVVEFDRELASLTKDEFVRQVLIDALDTRHLVVGANFRFGKGRQGDVRYLSRTLPALRTELTIVPAVIIAGGPVSSTRIRLLVGKGDVVGAERLLGRPFALRGTVGMGRQVGRTIGFPTANIEAGPKQLVPAGGVYAVECKIGETTYAGVCNIGYRPTFDDGARTIEVHLAGFEDDIYGETLDVVFRRRLRDEIAFESPERLVEQIRKDLEKAVGGC